MENNQLSFWKELEKEELEKEKTREGIVLNDNIEKDEKVIDQSDDEIIDFKYTITSYGADYPVDGLVKRLNNDAIFIPHFQRSYVWGKTQASRFIESLLLGLPVPGIFLSKEQKTQKLLVIDGQQRLKTLQKFYEGNLTLKGVQEKFEGKKYDDLNVENQRRLDDAILHATIIKQEEPSDDESSIYHIFERLNTGGSLLRPQEIRACIYHGKFNELLNELIKFPAWNEIYNSPSLRLKDQELILRFFAFFFQWKSYTKPLKEFLNKFMGINRDLELYDKETLEGLFKKTVSVISDALGKEAFRPNGAIVSGLFDSVMVGVANRLTDGPIHDLDQLVNIYNNLLDDKKFQKAIRKGTSDKSAVRKRMKESINAFRGLD